MEKERIKMFSDILELDMDEKRIDSLEPTFRDWMRRAKKLDDKVSRWGMDAPPAANIFKHF